jgi:hypothetical protein
MPYLIRQKPPVSISHSASCVIALLAVQCVKIPVLISLKKATFLRHPAFYRPFMFYCDFSERSFSTKPTAKMHFI